MAKQRLRRTRSLVLLTTALLVAIAAAPAYAADSSPALSVAAGKTAVTASVSGFPANTTVAFVATTTGGKGTTRVRTSTAGAAHVAFAPPKGYAGNVNVSATSGTRTLKKAVKVGATTSAPPASATPVANNSIPISPAGSLGQYNLSDKGYAMANRFVLHQNTTIDRWYFAINGEGADCVGGRDGYGSGNGGILYGRITEVDQATGFPTAKVLGSEKINGCEAWKRAMDEFDLMDTHQQFYVQFKPVAIQADKMYAFVLSNTDPSPGDGGSKGGGNHMSPNLNFAKVAEMGPNGKNTLDAKAPGAVYGLDPRETTMWTTDSGKTWKFGDEVGWYDNGEGTGKYWPGAYRVSGGKNTPHGWMYMNWPDEGSGSVTFTASATKTLTKAGGASSGEAVGVVTVKGPSGTGKTSSLKSGMVTGKLDKPVKVTKGQKYTVSVSGTVDVGSATGWDNIFDLTKSSPEPYTSDCGECGIKATRPMLYAM